MLGQWWTTWKTPVLPLALGLLNTRGVCRLLPSISCLLQCKDRLKEWETRGRDAWQAASQRLLQEASGGDA